jgi:transposase
MAKPLRPDELWKSIEPLLPPPKPRRFLFPGRKPIDDRKGLIGMLFVRKIGIRWEDLPKEMGCGSGKTCWRRLRDWHDAGVRQALHELLLAELNGADRIDWSRAVSFSRFVRTGLLLTRVSSVCLLDIFDQLAPATSPVCSRTRSKLEATPAHPFSPRSGGLSWNRLKHG